MSLRVYACADRMASPTKAVALYAGMMIDTTDVMFRTVAQGQRLGLADPHLARSEV